MTINGTGFDDPGVTVSFSKGGFIINSKVVSSGGTVITLNVTLPGGVGGTITLLNPDSGTSTLTSGFTVT
jgi:hypothetical protein